jgi:hypothetical protein
VVDIIGQFLELNEDHNKKLAQVIAMQPEQGGITGNKILPGNITLDNPYMDIGRPVRVQAEEDLAGNIALIPQVTDIFF